MAENIPFALIMKSLGLVTDNAFAECIKDEVKGYKLVEELIKEINYGIDERKKAVAKFCLSMYTIYSVKTDGKVAFLIDCPKELVGESGDIRKEFERQGVPLEYANVLKAA